MILPSCLLTEISTCSTPMSTLLACHLVTSSLTGSSPTALVRGAGWLAGGRMSLMDHSNSCSARLMCPLLPGVWAVLSSYLGSMSESVSSESGLIITMRILLTLLRMITLWRLLLMLREDHWEAGLVALGLHKPNIL